MLTPDQLPAITDNAFLGVNLVENYGLNQYYSLANKFFDYMHACVPQVTMDFPEYRTINEQFCIGILIADLREETIAAALNNLLTNDVLYVEMKANCTKARMVYNWQEEEKKLIAFYKELFS